MKKRLICKAISKGLLTYGVAVGLSVSSGIAIAAGQIAVVTNDTVVESGEEFGATVVLNGDGQYDVYVGITGGVFGADFQVFTPGGLVPWVQAEGPPPKLMDNVNLANMSIKERMIALVPRMPLAGYAGDYAIYGALSAPGQFMQQLQDGTVILDGPLAIQVK
jgi:hypothetical protein